MNDQQFHFSVPQPPEGEGRYVTAEEAERLLLAQLAEAGDDPAAAMWNLAQFYKSAGKSERAGAILRDLLVRFRDPETKAQIILALGQTAEQASDYQLAVQFYREALVLEPCDPVHWYFIHNNLGFSLNQLQAHAEGEIYCRRAIAIDAGRPNGFKNLGVALAGQGRLREAAEAWVRATMANAADDRSLKHLEALLAGRPELAREFAQPLAACRSAVQKARVEAERVWRVWREKVGGDET